ncbi:MAG: DUF3095 family protein [Candidatus Dojkabacteria bacterium]|nr:DUF3095 family protein [Candidatus Dojkabacteria bacterium]
MNFVSAAAVAAVVNLNKNLDFPFIFGGDGATILIHNKYLELAQDALRDTALFAKTVFNLNFKIGAVPILDVQRDRRQVRVAKYKVAEKYYEAVITGGGVEYAENLVKNDTKYQISLLPPKHRANYEGLECVWQDESTEDEEVVNLLVKDSSIMFIDNEVYKKVFTKIKEVYGDKNDRNPLKERSVKIKPSIEKQMFNIKLSTYQKKGGYKRKMVKMFFKHYFVDLPIYFSRKFIFKDKREYIPAETEKFDDGLKMILSGSSRQRRQLVYYLEELNKAGEIVYGINTSEKVHITCFLFERYGRQVHFLDGANGGYTDASKELKNRLRWQRLYMVK